MQALLLCVAQQATCSGYRLLTELATVHPLRGLEHPGPTAPLLAQQAKRKVLALRISAQALFAFFHGRYSTGTAERRRSNRFANNYRSRRVRSTCRCLHLRLFRLLCKRTPKGPEDLQIHSNIAMVACHSRTCNTIAKINCICLALVYYRRVRLIDSWLAV